MEGLNVGSKTVYGMGGYEVGVGNKVISKKIYNTNDEKPVFYITN
jgi:hypothetical protein